MKCFQGFNNNQNKKSCKDTIWLCLFLIFWCFLIIIIVYAIKYGNYTAVINGVDSFGNICNQTHNKRYENFNMSGIDTSEKPYLFYFDYQNYDGAVKICVENCPLGLLNNINDVIYYLQLPSQICMYDFNVVKEAMFDIERSFHFMNRIGPCPTLEARIHHFKKRCLPEELHRPVLKQSYDLLNVGGLDQLFFIAVYQAWNYVAVLCGFAFVISLILLALMFWLSKILPWLICLATIITNAVLCIELWSKYNKLPFEKSEENATPTPHHVSESGFIFREYFSNMPWDLLDEFRINNVIILYLTFFTMCVTIILIILTFIWMVHLNRLKLLFDEAVICMKNLPGLFIVPTIGLLSMILLIFVSGYTLLCITTSKYLITSPTKGTFDYKEKEDPIRHLRSKKFFNEYIGAVSVFQQIEYVDSKPIRRTFWIFIIGMFWTTEFIFAFEEFCIGAAVGFWYFTPSINNPSLNAIRVLFKYHLGTIVKGSAVIPLSKVPRLIYSLTFKRIKSKISQLWLRRIQFVEERIEIWNHNAFISAAMETTNLGSAAKNAWKIVSKNAEQIKIINNMFGFVLFVCKFFVAILTCLVGFKLLKERKDYLFNEDRHDLFFYIAPVLFSTFCAFCIAHIVFSVFEMTVDALLLCVSEDHQKNGRLKRFIMKSNLNKLFENSG